MIYQGGTRVDTRGLAFSQDGVTWKKYSDNPILSTDEFPIPFARTWDTALVYQDGRYLYLMELGDLGGTDLYLAGHRGSSE